jgi:2-oxoglutarate dehydrogenase E1 component
MARQDQNQNLLETSFLYGGNAAYIEDLHARFESDPKSVEPEWREFFQALNDSPDDVRKNAQGASWEKPNWPIHQNGELVSALDGNWAMIEKAVGQKIQTKAGAQSATLTEADLQRATRDSVRALMMIRAYRMRGHLHAQLDPLDLEPMKDHEELHPSSYGFTEADWDRRIFIDGVL